MCQCLSLWECQCYSLRVSATFCTTVCVLVPQSARVSVVSVLQTESQYYSTPVCMRFRTTFCLSVIIAVCASVGVTVCESVLQYFSLHVILAVFASVGAAVCDSVLQFARVSGWWFACVSCRGLRGSVNAVVCTRVGTLVCLCVGAMVCKSVRQ